MTMRHHLSAKVGTNFAATLHSWRPFLHPQLEDAPCRGDRSAYPLQELIGYDSLGKQSVFIARNQTKDTNTCVGKSGSIS
jgi:hypothetical protein